MRKNSLPILTAALTLGWLLAATPASASTASSPTSAEVTDALHATHVTSKLIDKLGTDALRISVSVSGETATLTGEVAKSSSQGLAGEVALSVDGIKKVDNKVTVKAPEGAVAASEASVKNVSLEMKLTEIGENALKIEVEAVDGVVSLRGKLGNPDVSKAAVKKTRSIKGVKKVVNLLG
jgi:osmotically-inducible protein OsmY